MASVYPIRFVHLPVVIWLQDGGDRACLPLVCSLDSRYNRCFCRPCFERFMNSPASTDSSTPPVSAPVIAIDGPSGAGKSTVARAVAARLGLLYLDTGALYRAVALKVDREGIDPDDDNALERLCETLSLTLQQDANGHGRVILDGVDVTDLLRTQRLATLASLVSAVPWVRARLLNLQQQMGARGGVVLDGRDIGTVVLPNADVKVYLDADSAVRAVRRQGELAEKGEPVPELAILQAQIERRDEADKSRTIAPLKQAADAVLIDSSQMDPQQVVDAVCDLVG